MCVCKMLEGKCVHFPLASLQTMFFPMARTPPSALLSHSHTARAGGFRNGVSHQSSAPLCIRPWRVGE